MLHSIFSTQNLYRVAQGIQNKPIFKIFRQMPSSISSQMGHTHRVAPLMTIFRKFKLAWEKLYSDFLLRAGCRRME